MILNTKNKNQVKFWQFWCYPEASGKGLKIHLLIPNPKYILT